jgi:hypothetical protein
MYAPPTKMYPQRTGSTTPCGLAEDLLIAEGQFPATRFPNGLMTKARQILQSLPTETSKVIGGPQK